jgi:hypothetical protein
VVPELDHDGRRERDEALHGQVGLELERGHQRREDGVTSAVEDVLNED